MTMHSRHGYARLNQAVNLLLGLRACFSADSATQRSVDKGASSASRSRADRSNRERARLVFYAFCLVLFVPLAFQLSRSPATTLRLRPTRRFRGEAVHAWILPDNDTVAGHPREYTTEECRVHLAEFLKPIHSPRPAPGDNSKTTPASAISPKAKPAPIANLKTSALTSKTSPTPAINTQTSSTPCLRLLVVIIFNAPLYSHAPFLRKLYEPFFHSVVIYGKVESAKFNVLAAKKTPGYLGDFQHYVISQATVEFPGYDGYMWCTDDLVFNFKEAFTFLDPDKIWLPVGYYGKESSPNIYDKRTDWLWSSSVGLPAVRNLYGCIPRGFREKGARWFGGPDRVTNSVGDFGYIPRRFVEDFRMLAFSFRYVFMEIALPTAFYMMSSSTDDFQVVSRPGGSATWLWTPRERRKPLEKLTNQTLILHPVKLNKKPDVQRRLLEKMDREWNWSKRRANIPWLHCI